VPQHDLVIRFTDPRFNEHIPADLQGLTPEEQVADPCYGLFSDGSVDPDGALPRTGSVVSEIYPITAATAGAPANLVQAPTLFVGRSRGNGDELRISWEVIAKIVPEEGSFLDQLIKPQFADVGLCSLSGPVSRLMFEDDKEPKRHMPPQCHSDGTGPFAITLRYDPEKDKNIPNNCFVLIPDTVRVDAFHPTDPNPDGLPLPHNIPGIRCGTAQYDRSAAEPVPLYGCMANGELFPACGLACGVSPTQDSTYRVRIDAANANGLAAVERWLRPNVMVVDGTRSIVRPMVLKDGKFQWQTDTDPAGQTEGPFRWAENFSPTVRVETVQIISRDRAGRDERVESPSNKLLEAVVPIAGQTNHSILSCTGRDTANGVLFDMAGCSSAEVDFTKLTPTYDIGNLAAATVVRTPIEWKVDVPDFPPDRQAFIRFGLRAQTTGAALRVSPALNFGSLPDSEYRQGTVQLENVGGEAMTIHEVALVPGQGQPQDFSVFTMGDPVPIPLPIEATTNGGDTTLRFGDLTEVPALTVDEQSDAVHIRFGDPSLAPGTPQNWTLYGEPTLLRGSILTRVNPSAVFTPSRPSYPRPFALQGYVEKTTPFLLRPGERVNVAVEVRPTAHGQRLATLRIRGVPGSNPGQTYTVQSQLQVQVVSGPLLQFLPNGIFIYRDVNGTQAGHMTATLFNAGHADLSLQQISISGSGASHFIATTDRGLGPSTLRTGEYLDIRVEYLPECDGTYGTGTSALDHTATLVVTSNGGTAAIALGGASQGFCP
jgi:hypothetical protein